MSRHLTAPAYFSDDLRPQMVKNGAWGGLFFAIVLGLHNYQVEGIAFGLIWGMVGLIIGIGVGILTCLSTNSSHSLLRLGQGIIQGTARGALIGTGLQALFVSMNFLMMRNGYPLLVSFSEAINGIRSFAICGGTLGLIAVMRFFMREVASENKRRQTLFKFILIGVASSLVLYGWLVFAGFFIEAGVTGGLLLLIPGTILSGIAGIIFAANR